MTKPLLGEYSFVADELGHALLTTICVAAINEIWPMSNIELVALLITGMAIDIDHIFNPVIGRFFGIKATITASKDQGGATVKTLHGIDVSLFLGCIVYRMSGDIGLSVGLFSVLSLHCLWDYMTYDHRWTELLLVTRLRAGFVPGQRDSHVGVFFDQESLPR